MQTKHRDFTDKVVAIVMFGPPTDYSGKRPGEFYQVTIDPKFASPSGRYLRFDQTIQGGDLHGWQSVDGITVCEVLGKAQQYTVHIEGYDEQPDATITLAEIDYG